MMEVNTVSQAAQDMLAHATSQYTFSFTPFLQKTYQHSLPADRPICKAYAAGNCPLKTRCPERHVSSNSSTGKESGGVPFGSLVCKHWLRGLCKKGEGCEFLHEYNLRKMPECNFFVRNGYCSNGDECLYLHIDPQSRLPPCPHYERGFCPLGPRCANKHVRRASICPYFMAGFCPDGRLKCKEGAHPKWEKNLEEPKVKEEKTQEEEERERMIKEEEARERMEKERERDGERGHDWQGQKDRFGGGGGGRGGRWRGRGGQRFRGRNH
jgi:cleavage and polyadenylation specificity factor subunit 4